MLLVLSLTVLSCLEKSGEQSVSIKEDTTEQAPKKRKIATASPGRVPAELILSTDNLRMFGDTTIEKRKIYLTSVKFEPYISFEDFKVDKIYKIYKGAQARLDFSSNKEAHNFRTSIRYAYKADTVNFAGHYTFVSWGCGSPCQSAVVVDRQSGKIYDAPSAALGYDFRPNSRMLIVNVPDSAGFYDDCHYCKPIIYVWGEETKTFMERRPR
jgi:hypothetical protein